MFGTGVCFVAHRVRHDPADSALARLFRDVSQSADVFIVRRTRTGLGVGTRSQECEPHVGYGPMRMVRQRTFFFLPAVTCRDVLLPLVSIRFKLFLEPRALRDETTIDPRLPQLPASSPPRHAVTYAVSHSSYLFLPFLTAGQNGYESDRRLPDMSVGVRERRDHARDRSGRRSK